MAGELTLDISGGDVLRTTLMLWECNIRSSKANIPSADPLISQVNMTRNIHLTDRRDQDTEVQMWAY